MANKNEKKLKLSFVNNGKEFILPKWTYRKHKEVLTEVSRYEKDLSDKDLDEKYQTILILHGLHQIDKNVTEDNLLDLHPEERLALFVAIYSAGKEPIFVEDFQKGQKKLAQKSKDVSSQVTN